MKRIVYLLFILSFTVMSCSDSNNQKDLDPTSFVFIHHEPIELPNCIAAYLDAEKNYIKIAAVGTLKQGVYSPEIQITDENVTDIYLFTDYISPRRFDAVYTLIKNKKNVFEMAGDTGAVWVDDITDSKQYPQ